MRWHQIYNEAKKEEWCPPGQRPGPLNWSSAAHKCRRNKFLKKTTKKQKLWQKKKLIFSTAGGANCLFNFYFSASSEKQKSPSMCFLAEVVKVRERGWKSKWKKREKSSVPSSSCPDAGLRSTFPVWALLLSRVESRREGEKEQDREGERVSNSGVRLNQSVRQAGRQQGSKAVDTELKAVGPSRLRSHSQDL